MGIRALNALQSRILKSLYPRSPDLLAESGVGSKLELLERTSTARFPARSSSISDAASARKPSKWRN